jgi:hypothetical protein
LDFPIKILKIYRLLKQKVVILFHASSYFCFYKGDQPFFTKDIVGSSRLGTTVNSGSSLFKNNIGTRRQPILSTNETKAKPILET